MSLEEFEYVTIFIKYNCEDVFIPTIFSPNEDFHNDTLFVRSDCVKDLTFSIYTRWGEKVFESKDKNFGWDGKFQGLFLSSSVFIYNLQGSLNDKTINRKGTILLVR